MERTVILADDHQPIDLCHLFGMEGLISSALLSNHEGQALGNEQPSETQALCSDILDMMLAQQSSFKSIEHRLLSNALNQANENMSKAASSVGLSRPQMAYRLKKYESDSEAL